MDTVRYEPTLFCDKPFQIQAPPDDTEHSQESDDSSLALLPRHTKVVITGNNRTKAELIGKSAVIRKSVGLGGWHFLILPSGEEVKLQRNALHVLEYGHDDEESSEEQNENQESNTMHRPTVPAAPAVHMKPRARRPPRPLSPSHEVKPTMRPKIVSPPSTVMVDLHKLDINSLRRYRRIHRLAEVGPDATKEQLLARVKAHFSKQMIDERTVLLRFMDAVRRGGGRAAAV